MIGFNQKRISDTKIANKPGRDTNESMFGGDIKEMRTRKSIKVGSINSLGTINFEQAWNRQSVKKDVVKITLRGEHIIVKRDELEQALSFMSQGDELIKYTAPKA